jgi:hypothetical protein
MLLRGPPGWEDSGEIQMMGFTVRLALISRQPAV